VALLKLILAGSLLLTQAAVLPAQDPPTTQQGGTPSEPDNDGFYSGNVVELAKERVTVSRTILNKKPEQRTFAITAATKVEGKLKAKSRVTVRYTSGDEGDVALSILVRPEKSTDARKK
jgi:hypothetical protein